MYSVLLVFMTTLSVLGEPSSTHCPTPHPCILNLDVLTVPSVTARTLKSTGLCSPVANLEQLTLSEGKACGIEKQVHRYVPTKTATSGGLCCPQPPPGTACPSSQGLSFPFSSFFSQPVSRKGKRLRPHDALALAIRSLLSFLFSSLSNSSRLSISHRLVPRGCFRASLYSPRRIWTQQPSHHRAPLPSKS